MPSISGRWLRRRSRRILPDSLAMSHPHGRGLYVTLAVRSSRLGCIRLEWAASGVGLELEKQGREKFSGNTFLAYLQGLEALGLRAVVRAMVPARVQRMMD